MHEHELYLKFELKINICYLNLWTVGEPSSHTRYGTPAKAIPN